jgi:hypothetical protein
MHLFSRPGIRYLRVVLLGASPGAPRGVAEFRAYNYLRDDLVLGADLSNIDNFRDRRYYVNPNPSLRDMGAGPHLLDVVADRGMEFIRLRIWNEPRNERTGQPRTLATRITNYDLASSPYPVGWAKRSVPILQRNSRVGGLAQVQDGHASLCPSYDLDRNS